MSLSNNIHNEPLDIERPKDSEHQKDPTREHFFSAERESRAWSSASKRVWAWSLTRPWPPLKLISPSWRRMTPRREQMPRHGNWRVMEIFMRPLSGFTFPRSLMDDEAGQVGAWVDMSYALILFLLIMTFPMKFWLIEAKEIQSFGCDFKDSSLVS